MKLSVTDQVGLLLALFFVIGGLVAVLRPDDLVFVRLVGTMKGGLRGELDHVTRTETRVYGAISVAAGTAFGGILIRGIRTSERKRRAVKTHGHL